MLYGDMKTANSFVEPARDIILQKWITAESIPLRKFTDQLYQETLQSITPKQLDYLIKLLAIELDKYAVNIRKDEELLIIFDRRNIYKFDIKGMTSFINLYRK